MLRGGRRDLATPAPTPRRACLQMSRAGENRPVTIGHVLPDDAPQVGLADARRSSMRSGARTLADMKKRAQHAANLRGDETELRPLSGPAPAARDVSAQKGWRVACGLAAAAGVGFAAVAVAFFGAATMLVRPAPTPEVFPHVRQETSTPIRPSVIRRVPSLPPGTAATERAGQPAPSRRPAPSARTRTAPAYTTTVGSRTSRADRTSAPPKFPRPAAGRAPAGAPDPAAPAWQLPRPDP